MRIFIETDVGDKFEESNIEIVPRIGETIYVFGGYWRVSEVIRIMEDQYTRNSTKLIVQEVD